MMQPRTLLMTLARVLLLASVLAVGAAACGGDDTDLALSPAAEAGRDITRTNGCAACHGRSGEGGPGPAFVGLFGSTVEFDDGTTAVADEEYIRQSILEPGARVVAGYGFPMPENDLSDVEIESVVAYIRELAEVAP